MTEIEPWRIFKNFFAFNSARDINGKEEEERVSDV